VIEVKTLTQDGQTAEEIGEWLVAFLDAARKTLDIAL
jgi:hypothetical protein